MNNTVERALVARIEQLESENTQLSEQISQQKSRIYQLETVLNNVWSSLPEQVQHNYRGYRE